MTTNQNAIQRIQKIFRDHFLNNDLVVNQDSSPITIEDWDSLAQVGLLAAIEKDFGVRFTADEMGDIANVGDILECLLIKGCVR